MRRRQFEDLVAQAFESLPEPFSALLDNVVVQVEDWPDRELLETLEMEADDLLFGLYEPGGFEAEGLVITTDPGMRLPDRILIFQRAIEAVCETPAEITEEIRKTVLHEVGHHFGLGRRPSGAPLARA